MPRFTVHIPWLMKLVLNLEAKNEKEAIQSATSKANPQLCHSCAQHFHLEGPAKEPASAKQR